MKKYLIGVTLFLFALSMPCLHVMASASPSDEIIEAAQEGLSLYGHSLTELAPVKSCDNLVIGAGFQIYTVTPDALHFAQGSDLSEMSIPMDIWRFIVLQKGTPVALMTVAKMDDDWKAVQFGSYDLAKEVHSVRGAFARDNTDFQFIRIFQATSDFIAVKKNGQTLGFSVMNSAVRALGIQKKRDARSLVQGSDIIDSIHQTVTERLANEPSMSQF